jgi:hypothetical protein
MSDYFGLGMGLVTCLAVLVWFEVTNRRALRKSLKDKAVQTTHKA